MEGKIDGIVEMLTARNARDERVDKRVAAVEKKQAWYAGAAADDAPTGTTCLDLARPDKWRGRRSAVRLARISVAAAGCFRGTATTRAGSAKWPNAFSAPILAR
jgi:hypothetical protein